MTPFEGQSLSQYIQEDVPAPVIDRGEHPPHSGSDFRSDQVGFLRAGTNDNDQPWKVISNFVSWAQAEVLFPENPEMDYAEVLVRDSDGRTSGPRNILLRRFPKVDEWVISEFGIRHRMYPGVRRDVILNAIQVASGTPQRKTAYDRLGVVYTPEGEARFLTGQGAIHPGGNDSSIRVDVPPLLQRYSFRPSEDVEDERQAMRAVLLVLTEVPNTDRGKMAVIVLLATAFRTPMFAARAVRFMVSVVGETGAGKSGLVSLILNHFGKDFAHDRLPTTWKSTGVSLLGLMHKATHVPLVIDNYIERPGPAGAYQRAAREMVSQAIGDGSVRGANNRDGTRRRDQDIGALVISTQEQMGVDQQASESARQVVLKIEKRGTPDISIDKMEALQLKYGHTGVLSTAMYGFINRFLSNLEAVEDELQSAFDYALDYLKARSGALPHERIARNVAELMIGWNAMVAYAQELGVFDDECPHTADSLHSLANDAFVELVKAQALEQNEERPEEIVLELLREALRGRKASLRDRHTDGRPTDPIQAGWDERTVRSFGGGTEYVQARHQIGWIDDDFIFLLPKITYTALAELAKLSETTMPVGERQLGNTLQRAGISEPGHANRPTRNEQVGLSGKSWVIKIHRRHIFDESISTDAYEDNEGNVVEIRRSA